MIPKLPKGFSLPVKIGSGGFGNVYRVRQNELNRFVAIKFIQDKNPLNRLALKKEASMQAGLHIPAIPQIYDVMEYSRQVCIVMQWINGADLRTFLKQPLTIQERTALATEIISVVALLHNNGYAHRDIKPENILISVDGVFLIDFGLTRSKTFDKRGVQIEGTPAYIAPELWQGRAESSDPLRSDVFALGKVISEMFENSEMPFCIQESLAQNPEERYSSASEFLDFWNKSVQIEPSNWRELASFVANNILSNQLLSASQLYLDHGRNEDAYQLLIESVQINPDNPAALQALDDFPVVKNNRNSKKFTHALYGFFFVLILLTVVFFVFIKHYSVKSSTTLSFPDQEGKVLYISSDVPGTKDYNRDLPFKDSSYELKSLSGKLQIVGHPIQGQLIFDGKIQPDTGFLTFVFPSVNHIALWKNTDQNITWKEVVKVLPFEEKRIWIKGQ